MPRRWWASLLLVAVMCAPADLLAAPPEAATPTMRVRVVWASAAPVRWSGRLSISGGELAEVQLLGRERDTPGSIWTEDGQVMVFQPRPRTFDGLDCTARAPLDATLRIELRAEGQEQSNLVEIPLAELMRDTRRSTLSGGASDSSTTLVVHRLQDDALRVDLGRDSLVCDPGETLRMQVTPAIADLEPGGAIDLSAELFRDRGGQREWEHTTRVALPVDGYANVPVEIPLPMVDGVYSIRLTASTPPGNSVRLWKTPTGTRLAQRTFQVVVLGETTNDHFAGGTWRTTVEIDPANPKWYSRLSEWTRLDRLTNLGNGPMGSEESRTTNMSGRTLVQLSASRPERPTWQAYPLPAAQPGKPHVVEVELPTGHAQQLAIRVYEYNSAGKLVPNGTGAGVVVDDQLAGQDGSPTENSRYLFWPRTRTPVVVIENVRQDTTGRYGRIRLRVAERGQGDPPKLEDRGRMVAASFGWQSLIDRTGVRVPNADGRMPVDDLLTFYQMAERTAALLELSGYNGAVVGVMDGGSAAFDLGNGQSLPILNTSCLMTGTDLPAINPTELMARIFSRRGLRLTPSLRLNSSLPAVEANLRQQKYKTLEDYPIWTDTAGRRRSVVLPELAVAQPDHYRLSHPDVAAEIESIVARLTQQCAEYPAFAGVALDFSADSYLASPPASYGLSRARLAKLAKTIEASPETLKLWYGDPRVMLADAAARKAWIAQRAEESTSAIQRLSDVVAIVPGEAKLWIETSQLCEMRELDVRPTLVGERRLEEIYMERGIDVAALRNIASIESATVWHQTTGLKLTDAARALELNAQASKSSIDKPHGVVVWHHTAPVAEPEGAEFVAARHPTTPIAFDLLGAGAGLPLAAVTQHDAGGPVVVGGSVGPGMLASDGRRAMLELLASLPATGVLSEKSKVELPVVARVYQSPNQAVAIATNDSPWPVTATVTLDVGQRTTAVPMSTETENATPTLYSKGPHAWSVKLAPYESRALRFETDSVEASSVRVELDPSVQQTLAKRCEELESRDLKPITLSTYKEIANPSFEEVDAAGVAIGWQGGDGVATVTPGVDGSRAAVIKSDGPATSITTLSFPVPGTGQIAVTAQVKVVELSDDAQLKLIVEDSGRHTPVALSAAQLKEHSAAKEWSKYQFGVEDLPLDSTSEMRIRIELTGSGEVWIDDLKLHELVYPLDIYRDESNQKVLALVQHVKSARKALEAQQYAECLSVLDSYWSRFVLEHLPEIQTPEADAIAPAEPKPKEPEATPRLSDRVKGWFRF